MKFTVTVAGRAVVSSFALTYPSKVENVQN